MANPEDIIEQMQRSIAKQNEEARAYLEAQEESLPESPKPSPPIEEVVITAPIPAVNAVWQEEPNTWLSTLPQLQPDEFLIDIDFKGKLVIFCVRELDWATAMDIEARSYRQNEADESYFAGEYERRETLASAILWVADTELQRILTNKDGRILKKLHPDIVDALWLKYHPLVTLGSEEAGSLYKSAIHYFSGQSQDGYPIPALIVEVDLMRKLGGLTRVELRQMKVSELERIQLILMARSECINISESTMPMIHIQRNVQKTETEELPANFFPPSVRNNPELRKG